MMKHYPNNYKYYTVFGWNHCEIKPYSVRKWNRRVKYGKELSVHGARIENNKIDPVTC